MSSLDDCYTLPSFQVCFHQDVILLGPHKDIPEMQ